MYLLITHYQTFEDEYDYMENEELARELYNKYDKELGLDVSLLKIIDSNYLTDERN